MQVTAPLSISKRAEMTKRRNGMETSEYRKKEFLGIACKEKITKLRHIHIFILHIKGDVRARGKNLEKGLEYHNKNELNKQEFQKIIHAILRNNSF